MKFQATETINLRSLPSINGAKVGSIAKGTVVESDEYKWKAVTLPNGDKGYCAAEYLEPPPVTGQTNKWFAPIAAKCFTVGQPFLNPDPLTYPKCKHHPGVDYPLKGATNVQLYYCADGEVIESGSHPQFGNYFFYYVPEVDRTFVYFHLREDAPPKGKYKGGEQAGFAGTTGKSTGPHLHLECMKGRKTSKDRGGLYTSKEALMACAEDANVFIRSKLK